MAAQGWIVAAPNHRSRWLRQTFVYQISATGGAGMTDIERLSPGVEEPFRGPHHMGIACSSYVGYAVTDSGNTNG